MINKIPTCKTSRSPRKSAFNSKFCDRHVPAVCELMQTVLLTHNHLVTASPLQPFPPVMSTSAKVSGEAGENMLMPGDFICTIHARTYF